MGIPESPARSVDGIGGVLFAEACIEALVATGPLSTSRRARHGGGIHWLRRVCLARDFAWNADVTRAGSGGFAKAKAVWALPETRCSNPCGLASGQDDIRRAVSPTGASGSKGAAVPTTGGVAVTEGFATTKAG